MKKNPVIILVCLWVVFSVASFAQEKTFNVWTGKIPGAIDDPAVKEETIKTETGAERVRYVTNPTLTAFYPPKEKANGTAVIICPGGGYIRLAMPHEGYDVGKWFSENGVTAFVLKYRLPDDRIMQNKAVGPLQDIQESVRLVRRNAKEWGIDPNKIGVVGFSAGGHLASTVSTHYKDKVYDSDSTSARPDFSVLVYAVVSLTGKDIHAGSAESLLGKNPDVKLLETYTSYLQVTKDTPPAFLVCSQDDKTVPLINSVMYYLAMKANNIPGELHIYEKGGHGYGLAPKGGSESAWPEALKKWMKQRSLL
jgi:acetyl esterase/lipase